MGKWNKTPEGTATAFSSCGEFDFDIRTGKVTRTALTRAFGPKPVRVDVPEHLKWYRSFLTAGFACDICGLGYWSRKEYHPANKGWREDLLANRLEDAYSDFGKISVLEKQLKAKGLREEREYLRQMKLEKRKST